MDGHSLVELAHMLHRVYLMREGWLRDLIQSFNYGIITRALTGWALMSPSMTLLFFIREGFAWGSSWSPPVTDVLLFIRGYVGTGRGLHLLCMAQSPFQVIDLSLHGLTIVLSLGYATTYLGMALACLGSMYTPLSIPFIALILLRVRRITLPLRPNGFCSLGIGLAWVFLVWTWPYHV